MKLWPILCFLAVTSAARAQLPNTVSAMDACHGAQKPMLLLSGTPFMRLRIQDQEGLFLLDFATTRSVIDVSAFPKPPKPDLSSGLSQFDISDYFGAPFLGRRFEMQYLVKYVLNDVSGNTYPEAGILGTDLLNYAFTLDFRQPTPTVYKQFQGNQCPESILRKEGFLPVSTMGFFAYPIAATDDTDEPLPVLTVPLRINGVWSPAQVDTGFSDVNAPHSINFNRALLRDLRAHGVRLRPVTVKDLSGIDVPKRLSLTTCIPDVSEFVTEYLTDDDVAAEIMGTNGTPVVSVTKLRMFLKETPLRAKSCGGVGTWDKPGAQLGSSFMTENDAIVVDAYSALLWIRQHP